MFSTLGQPNWLGAYLSILLFPLIAIFISNKIQAPRSKEFLSSKSKNSNFGNWKFGSWNLVLGILIILFYLCLTWTKSQSAFLGFWAGFVVFVGIIKFISWKKEGIDGIKFWKNPLLKTCAIIAGMFVAFNLLVGFPIERLNTVTVAELIKKQIIQPKAPSAETALSDVGGTNSGKIRLIVWRGAIDVFKHNPILGSGVETFAYSYYKYRPIEHNQTSEWDYLYNKAHNEYLNYAATTGILGIGSYLFIIGLFFWTCGKYILGLKPNKVFRISENNRTADPLSFLSSPNSTLLALSLISSYVSILISFSWQ
jgi:O-antigen ligase